MKGIFRYIEKRKKKKALPDWTDEPERDAVMWDEWLESQEAEDIEDDLADMMFNERYNR